MEMKLNVKDAKKAAEQVTEQRWAPIKMLHRWGMRSDHAYLGGFIALGLALVWRIFLGARRSEHGKGSGWAGIFGKAAPLLFLIGLGLDREE